METFIVSRATGCTRFLRLRSVQSPANILFVIEVCSERSNTRRDRARLRGNARFHRVLRRVGDSRWRRCRRVVRGCVPRGSATSGARASAHQRRRFLSFPLSPFESARLGDASRVGCCEIGRRSCVVPRRAAAVRPSVLHEVEVLARVSRLISVRRSMGPVALGVAPWRGIAEDSRHRHGILSPPSAENSGIGGWIRANKILLGQGSFYCFSLFILSFSFFLSPLLLRANVTKSAVANALRSGLPLENREEELLPRGESIPRSLWWSKGDCRNERRRASGESGREGCHEERGWMALGYSR